jgi:exodeoxyribonuclease VII large subunit
MSSSSPRQPVGTGFVCARCNVQILSNELASVHTDADGTRVRTHKGPCSGMPITAVRDETPAPLTPDPPVEAPASTPAAVTAQTVGRPFYGAGMTSEPLPSATSSDEPPAVPVASALSRLASSLRHLPTIWVDGEVSSVTDRNGTGPVYARLCDPEREAEMPLLVWRDVFDRYRGLLKPGDRVHVQVQAGLWVRKGTLQFQVLAVRAVGLGALLAAIEERRHSYQAEGLFDAGRKKPLPPLPGRIGVIAGRGSDALRDFERISALRWPSRLLEVRAVPVQGPGAVAAMTAALAELDAEPSIEVIVLTRGGGSVEDLLPFSEDGLCRAIAAASTPVVTAVGHEADTPLCDLVADVRASTPTDAANRTTPNQATWLARLDEHGRRLNEAVAGLLEQRGRTLASADLVLARRVQDGVAHRVTRLNDLAGRQVLASPQAPLVVREQRLERLAVQAARAVEAAVGRREERLEQLTARLQAAHPVRVVTARERQLDVLDGRLVAALRALLAGHGGRMLAHDTALRAADPLRRVTAHERRLAELAARMPFVDPASLIRGRERQLDGHATLLARAMAGMHERAEARLTAHDAALRIVSPLATLQRGYAIVQTLDGLVLRSPDGVTDGQDLRLRLAEGDLSARAVS